MIFQTHVYCVLLYNIKNHSSPYLAMQASLSTLVCSCKAARVNSSSTFFSYHQAYSAGSVNTDTVCTITQLF